jgi:hypothetical protein
MTSRVARTFGVALAAASLLVMPGQWASASDATSALSTAYVCGRGLDTPPCAVKPADLEFSDNHDLVATGMAWSSWGKATATAAGDITVNWTGTPETHRGTVRLYDLRSCHGQRAYRRGQVSWPGESVKIQFDCGSIPAQSRLVMFHSKDNALGCAMSWDVKYGSSARCDVQGAHYTTPKTADCQDLDQGDSLVLGEAVASTCHGDTVLRAGKVLANGESRRVGDIRCSMAQSGVTCRNVVTGHGFRMSRASYRTW